LKKVQREKTMLIVRPRGGGGGKKGVKLKNSFLGLDAVKTGGKRLEKIGKHNLKKRIQNNQRREKERGSFRKKKNLTGKVPATGKGVGRAEQKTKL